MKLETKLKNWTNGKWKKELWKVFAKYIKTRDNYTCFTCGNKGEGSGMHAGHFIEKSVGGLSLYFDERNVHAQCYRCNINLGGHHSEYYPRMIKKYGQDVVDELLDLKRNGYRKISNQEYADLIEKYQKKLDEQTTHSTAE